MHYLNQFNSFDCNGFLKDKTTIVTACKPWTDYEDKSKVLGTRVEVVIYQDNTQYKQKPGENVTNLFEKFTYKVKRLNLQLPPKTVVTPVNPVGQIYGDFRNSLSVTCDDLQVVPRKS